MINKPQQYDSQLFTVRLWAEDMGHGQVEWRGKVQHVVSGKAHYFRDWHVLIALLQDMLPGIDASSAHASGKIGNDHQAEQPVSR